jgi:hypothetical protein
MRRLRRERHHTPWGWGRKVKHSPARPQKFVDEEEINEHVLEYVVAVNEGKIDRHTLLG